MHKVTSADGTSIAYERFGDGPAVIVVGGAACDRGMTRPLAEALARHFSVINYDRRGRGDSGDTGPYAVGREVEDLAALIAEAGGGPASLYGHSSGAGLVLHAAARGLPVSKVVLHEPPFEPDEATRQASQEAVGKIRALLAEGRRSEAFEAHMLGTGMPPEMLDEWRTEPWWAALEANAPTLLYDFELMDDASRGGATAAEQARAVTVPALVICGGASPDWMIEVDREVADALPEGRLMVLEGQEHVVPPEILVPVLAEFLAD